MQGTLSPDVVRAAVGLRLRHPRAPSLYILDACFRQRGDSLEELGPDALDPCGPFGQLLAAALDKGMPPSDWQILRQPDTVPAVRDALLQVWRDDLVGTFAGRYTIQNQEGV